MTGTESIRARLAAQAAARREASWKLFKLTRLLKLAIILSQVAVAVLIALVAGRYALWLVLASLVPLIIGMAQRMFASEEASGWHYNKAVAVERLVHDIDCGSDPKEVEYRYLDLDEEMAKTFPQGSWF